MSELLNFSEDPVEPRAATASFLSHGKLMHAEFWRNEFSPNGWRVTDIYLRTSSGVRVSILRNLQGPNGWESLVRTLEHMV